MPAAGEGGKPVEAGGCPGTDLLCDGGCVPNDTHHCGTCGNDRTVPTLCGNACVDTTTSATHCGSCTTVCTTGANQCSSNPSNGVQACGADGKWASVMPPTITGPSSFCSGGSVTLTANARSAVAYAWSNGSTQRSITVSAGNTFTVRITDANGCSATSAGFTVTQTAGTGLVTGWNSTWQAWAPRTVSLRAPAAGRTAVGPAAVQARKRAAGRNQPRSRTHRRRPCLRRRRRRRR